MGTCMCVTLRYFSIEYEERLLVWSPLLRFERGAAGPPERCFGSWNVRVTDFDKERRIVTVYVLNSQYPCIS